MKAMKGAGKGHAATGKENCPACRGEMMMGHTVRHGSGVMMGPAKMGTVMKEFKAGGLRSGSRTGPKVTSRKQAIAIGMAEARKAGHGGH